MSIALGPELPRHPEFIDPTCPDCGTELVLADVLLSPEIDPWLDEWICPNHVEDGVFLDWPPEQHAELQERFDLAAADPSRGIPFETVLQHLADQEGITLEELQAEIDACAEDDDEPITRPIRGFDA